MGNCFCQRPMFARYISWLSSLFGILLFLGPLFAGLSSLFGDPSFWCLSFAGYPAFVGDPFFDREPLFCRGHVFELAPNRILWGGICLLHLFLVDQSLGVSCLLWELVFAKAVTYNERPKMKRDARLKAVFFPRKRLLSVWHPSSFLRVRRTLRL